MRVSVAEGEAVIVGVQYGVAVTSENCAGAVFADLAVQHCMYCLCLCGGGYDAEHVFRGDKCGNRECHGVGRHLIDGIEAAVIYLLMAAYLIEFDCFDCFFVVKFCESGVVERDMTVFSDTHADDVALVLGKELCIPVAFGVDIGCVAVDIVD